MDHSSCEPIPTLYPDGTTGAADNCSKDIAARKLYEQSRDAIVQISRPIGWLDFQGGSKFEKAGSLLKDKHPKFEFQYQCPSLWDRHPWTVGIIVGAEAGLSFAMPKYGRQILAGIEGTGVGFFDIGKLYSQDNHNATIGVLGIMSVTAFLGSALIDSFPQTRRLAWIFSAVGLASSLAQKFVPGEELLTGIKRTNGKNREPFLWGTNDK